MADNNLIKEKLRIVKELKEIQEKEGVNAAKLNDTYIKHLARLKEIQKELLDTNEAYKKGIESISKMGDGVASLSSVYSELKDNVAKSAETQTKISNSMAEQINRGDAISERNIRAQAVAQDIMSNYREQQSLAVELAQLDESQVTEKAKILDELGIYNQLLKEQLGTLDKRTAVGKEFMSINSELSQTTGEMVDKAKELSSLSEQQKQTLEDQAAVADTINEKFRSLEESIVSILSRPTALIGGIVAGLGKVISALGETTREMGGFVGGLTGAVGQVTLLKTVFPQALDSAKGLSSEFGGLNDLSFKTQLNTNLMAMNMGIGGQEAASLVGNFARLNGGSIETAQNLAASTKELAKANGLMPSQVMADVAGSAEAFAQYGKEGGKNIGEAAVAAGKLGTNMSTLTGITDNLLDFESSITKELELGAMLGKNINLTKARQLAYEGQIGASVKEALNQMGGIDAFNRMDVFQKRQAAAALGISVAELQKMSSNMDKLNDDGTMQLSTFDTISETITGIATGGMGGLITKFGVFLGALGQANMGWQAMKKSIGGIVGGIWSGLKYLMKWPIQLAKAAAMKAGSLLGFGGGAAKAATSVASTAASTTANVAGSVAKGGGMASMAAGLAAFANPATLLGLAAVTAAIIGIGFALRIAAPGIEAFGKAVASIVVAVGEVVGNLIGAITTSIVTLMDNVTLEKVGAIALLSLAFLGLAGSLYLLGSAGIFALPALLGIAAASAGLVMVAEILGIGGESSSEETGALEEGSMSEYQKNVILELQTLQDVMRKGLIVNLDGTKVNRGIQAADNRSLSNSVIQ
jgi:hypothetical protein